MKELKRCPFCGGEAEFHRIPIKTNGGWCDSVVVRCKKCEARTNRVLYNKEKHGVGGEYDEAAAAWNTRKQAEQILDRLEKLKNYEADGDCPRDGMCNKKPYECTSSYSNSAIEIVKEEMS